MNIGIDMRPFYTPEMGAANLYHLDLLEGLFRNHAGDVFYLWTSGKRRPKNMPNFEQYTNVQWVHTKISDGRLAFWTQSFGYPYIDDIIETQAMKEGHMAWISQLDAMIFLAPTLAPIERNCLHVQVIESCSPLHFPEYFDAGIQKIHTLSAYNRQVEQADLIFVPSGFVKKDLISTCKKSEKEHITVLGVGILEEDSLEEEKKTNILEKELLFQHEKEEEETLVSEVLPPNFFFARGIGEHLGNITQVIQAYTLFRARFEENAWDLVIEEEQPGDLEEYAQKAGITIVPPLTPKERRDVLQKAKAFLYPALYDGDGSAIIEAMRHRCPVLHSRFGALPEVSHGHGIMFSPTSEHSILRAMKKIFRDSSFRDQLLDPAEERSHHSRFQWDEIAAHCMHRIAERIEEKIDEDDE